MNPMDTDAAKIALNQFYKERTTFNIRWKKELLRDSIAPGVYVAEFLEEFTRAELKKYVSAGLVKKDFYREPDSRILRACVIYIAFEMPQVREIPIQLERIKRAPLWPTLVLLALLVLGLALVIRPPRAWGFAQPQDRADLLGPKPWNTDRGYFDDPATGVRCYWLSHEHVPILSCVKK